MANTPLNNKSTKKDIDQYINKLTDTHNNTGRQHNKNHQGKPNRTTQTDNRHDKGQKIHQKKMAKNKNTII